MFKNKEKSRNNICGTKIRERRLAMENVSQRKLAELLSANGLSLDKNAIQRIESGQRFLTDIELKAISEVLHVSYAELLD